MRRWNVWEPYDQLAAFFDRLNFLLTLHGAHARNGAEIHNGRLGSSSVQLKTVRCFLLQRRILLLSSDGWQVREKLGDVKLVARHLHSILAPYGKCKLS